VRKLFRTALAGLYGVPLPWLPGTAIHSALKAQARLMALLGPELDREVAELAGKVGEYGRRRGWAGGWGSGFGLRDTSRSAHVVMVVWACARVMPVALWHKRRGAGETGRCQDGFSISGRQCARRVWAIRANCPPAWLADDDGS
jgi:hypothetical protein